MALILDFFRIEFRLKGNSKVLKKNKIFIKNQFFSNYLVNYYHLIENNKTDDLAIHFFGENNFEERITYKELNLRINALSSYYLSLNIKKGDIIVGYLPNITDTIIAFLASAKIGAVWSSCSADFGSKAVIDRFSQLKPKLFLIADYYFYNGKKFFYSKNVRTILQKIGNPKILRTSYPSINKKSDLDKIYKNKKFQNKQITSYVDFNHPLYVLFSSGTTGLPKCIAHGHGGSLLQHLKELSLHTNVKRDDKYFF